MGRHLVRRLGEAGYHCVLPTRRPHRHRDLKLDPGVELRALVRLDRDALVAALRGSDLVHMRHLAADDEDVEDVRAFGDRLHLRVKPPRADSVIKRLKHSLPAAGVPLTDARSIPPTLEDVFIHLARS